jgi:hypothetical protein
VARRRSAKPLFIGSNPIRASNHLIPKIGSLKPCRFRTIPAAQKVVVYARSRS